jgi:hypothetical protein
VKHQLRASPQSIGAGAQALAAWLDAAKDPMSAVPACIFDDISSTASQVAADRKAEREKLL